MDRICCIQTLTMSGCHQAHKYDYVSRVKFYLFLEGDDGGRGRGHVCSFLLLLLFVRAGIGEGGSYWAPRDHSYKEDVLQQLQKIISTASRYAFV